MPLVQGYSSDEDDATMSPTHDAFGISAIPVSKKARIEDAEMVEKVETSAPDVLAEVRRSVMYTFLHPTSTSHI